MNSEATPSEVKLLTVIVPAYNEESTVEVVLRRVRSLSPRIEIITVDDGSTDETLRIITALSDELELQVRRHTSNRGKGAAIQTALQTARGMAVAVQDADLEYDPSELLTLLVPIIEGEADIVFGNRFHSQNRLEAVPLHFAANALITWCCNWFLTTSVSDVETCFKVVRRECLSAITLEETGFGIEIEMAIKLMLIPGLQVRELPISYRPRTRAEGKKIRAHDGIRALWCILKYGSRRATALSRVADCKRAVAAAAQNTPVRRVS